MRILLSEYETLRDKCDKKWVHVRLIDLSRALNALTLRKRFYALAADRMPQTQAARALGISQPAVSAGTASTLDELVNYMNGEHE